MMEHTLGVPGEWLAGLIMSAWPEWVGTMFGLFVLFGLALISPVLLYIFIRPLIGLILKLLKWLPQEIFV